MSRAKLPIRKSTALILWADAPLALIGALVLIQHSGYWAIGAWVCWVLIGILALNNKRIRYRFRRKTQQRRQPQPKIDLGPRPWAGPGKQPRTIEITGKQMEEWFADEATKLNATETGTIETEDGEEIEYNVIEYNTYMGRKDKR